MRITYLKRLCLCLINYNCITSQNIFTLKPSQGIYVMQPVILNRDSSSFCWWKWMYPAGHCFLFSLCKALWISPVAKMWYSNKFNLTLNERLFSLAERCCINKVPLPLKMFSWEAFLVLLTTQIVQWLSLICTYNCSHPQPKNIHKKSNPFDGCELVISFGYLICFCLGCEMDCWPVRQISPLPLRNGVSPRWPRKEHSGFGR